MLAAVRQYPGGHPEVSRLSPQTHHRVLNLARTIAGQLQRLAKSMAAISLFPDNLLVQSRLKTAK